ncbi:MAG: hypothetical protein IPP82_03645 [Xanthomonadales bacterium]|nr:hypothetical protein [Xanthomonadales bacterium]
MAQLPSGRHVAIQATPLFDLIDAACTPDAVITRLLQIERLADLSPYIDVLFFREVPAKAALTLAPGGQPVPSGIEPFASGYTLATIHEAVCDWSREDQRAFAEYLGSDRVQSHLSALLDRVNEVRHRLGREGDFVLRLQALMWESGCHPLQNDERDNPIYALLHPGGEKPGENEA